MRLATVTLPAATGGDGTLTYALSPSLPSGLSFDADARTISGTPSAAAASATYTYTVVRRGQRHRPATTRTR